jgi:hypothetical protein
MLRPLAFRSGFPLPAALAALALAALALAAPASAQTFTTLQQDAQAQVSDLAALGMGGAVAAAPTLDSPFFSNPAHMAGTERFSLTALGLTAGVGGNVRETYDFYENELGPAIEEGLDEIRTNDPDRLQALYDEAFRIGRSQKTADVAVLAPSLRMRFGQVAVGAGVYGSSITRAKISDGGAGIPYLDAYSQADVLVPLAVATDVPGLPFRLQVGGSATYVQRRIAAKADAIDALDPDSEKLYVFRGDGVRLGLGLDARDVGTPGLDLGLAVTNIGGALDVEMDDSFPIEGPEDAPDDAAEIARLEARFDGREAASAVRAGAAYRIPVPHVAGLPLSDVTAAVDYTSASTSEFDQSFQAGLRGGVRATLARVLELRTGLSQGMVSAGLSLKSRFARIDYATYGVEDGRLLGQQNRRNHVVQIRFGLF